MKNIIKRTLTSMILLLVIALALSLSSCGKCELDDSTPDQPYHGEWIVSERYQCGATKGRYECPECGDSTSEWVDPNYSCHILPDSSWDNYIPGRDRTCYDGGEWAQGLCPYCGYFINEADIKGQQASSDFYTPLDHKIVTVEEKAATCTEDGHSSYTYCELCNEMNPDGNGSFMEPYFATGHEYGMVDEAYGYCINCNEFMVNTDGGYFFKDGIIYHYGSYDNAYTVRKIFDTTVSELVIPDTINGKDVVFFIDDETFVEFTNLTKLTLPKLTDLGTTNLPEALITIENETKYFANGDNKYYFLLEQLNKDVTEIIINPLTKQIMANAFHNCDYVETLIIPEGVENISYAFTACSSLRSVVLPTTIKYMGSAFQYCSSLVEVVIPEGITEIGSSTFEGCTSLTSLTLPKSVKLIDSRAFYNSGIVDINLDNVEELGYESFRNSSIKNVYLPNAKRVGGYAFSNCMVETAYIPGADTVVEGYGLAFYYSANANVTIHINNINAIYVANVVTILGEGVFPAGTLNGNNNTGRHTISHVVIGDGFTSIEEGAISEISVLESITFGAGITTVVPNAFRDLPELTKVYVSENIRSFKTTLTTHYNNCPKLILNRESYGESVVYYIGSVENPYIYVYSAYIADDGQTYTLTLPEGVVCIPEWTFSVHLQKLQFVVPSTVKYVGYAAFGSSDDIYFTTSEHGNYYIGNAENPYLILYSANMEWGDFYVRSETVIIMDNAFYNAETLTVHLHDGVVQIPEGEEGVVFVFD